MSPPSGRVFNHTSCPLGDAACFSVSPGVARGGGARNQARPWWLRDRTDARVVEAYPAKDGGGGLVVVLESPEARQEVRSPGVFAMPTFF